MSHDTGEPSAEEAFQLVSTYVDDQPLETGLTLLSSYRNKLDALEAELVAAQLEESAGRRDKEPDPGAEDLEGSWLWL